MRKQTFFLELFLVAVYVLGILMDGSLDIYNQILALLLYLIIKILYYIYEEKPFSRVLVLVTVIYIMGLAVWIDPRFMMFLTLNTMQLLKGEGIHVAAAVTILASTAYYGFNLLTITVMGFTWLYYQYINSLSCKLAIAIEENRSLKRDLFQMEKKQQQLLHTEASLQYTSKLEEREHIAQQLHDELGHTLSGNTMHLEAVKLLMQKQPEKAEMMLDKVIENLRSGSESIRQILKDIKPELASINMEKIKQMINETQEQSGVKIQLTYDHFVQYLTQQQWLLIDYNIKESLTNMMRYAKATECHVSFEALAKHMKITVRDNGRGQVYVKKGTGLQGMQNRLAAIGGQLIVDGQQGFSVIMILPLERSNS